MAHWDKLDRTAPPTMELVTEFVAAPLWNDFIRYLEETYQAKPAFEYSGCSVPGWNVKYRKAGRSLCTLYPMEGCFVALVVVGAREKHEFDLALPTFTPYTRELYQRTKDKNGLCWLMFQVKDDSVLPDVKRCIAIRRGAPKK